MLRKAPFGHSVFSGHVPFHEGGPNRFAPTKSVALFPARQPAPKVAIATCWPKPQKLLPSIVLDDEWVPEQDTKHTKKMTAKE